MRIHWGYIIFGFLLAGCVAFAVAWPLGLQHWLAIQTGTCPEIGNCSGGAGGHYGYWSGFGSVFPWSPLTLTGIFGAIGLWYKKHNCHIQEGFLPWGCWRLGHHSDASGTFMLCRKHHPHVAGKKLTVAFVHRHHYEHLAKHNPPSVT